MKGGRLLLVLLLLAAAAAALIILRNPGGDELAEAPPGAVFRFVCGELNRPATNSPALGNVPQAVVKEQTAELLTGRFGEDGLARRSRAYALLHLLPEAQDLRDQMARALASSNRGVARGPQEAILYADDLDLAKGANQARLARLFTLALLGPPPPGADDTYLAHWAVLGGIASEIEVRYLIEHDDASPLPSDHEIGHEVLLLTLPIFTHNLVQLPLMEGRNEVQRRLGAGETFAEILAAPPLHTLALLAPAAIPDPAPKLPERPGLVLEETLGAYSTRLLCERLSDLFEATDLGPEWRADRYGLYQSDEGEHLLWISCWASEEAAAKVAGFLQARVTPDDPTGRHQRVLVDGATVTFANCADEFTLDEFLPAPLGGTD